MFSVSVLGVGISVDAKSVRLSQQVKLTPQ
jgi:hypothetical protein